MSEIIQVGKILSSAPRAVRIRTPKDQENAHSAIHASVDILTDSVKEAQAILAKWPEIVEEIASKITELVAALEDDPEDGPNKKESPEP